MRSSVVRIRIASTEWRLRLEGMASVEGEVRRSSVGRVDGGGRASRGGGLEEGIWMLSIRQHTVLGDRKTEGVKGTTIESSRNCEWDAV